MNDKEYAKNILLDRNCRRCIYYVWEQGDVEFCERLATDNKENPYEGTIPIPKEFTCEKWRDELDYKAYVKELVALEIATDKENIDDIMKIINYKEIT